MKLLMEPGSALLVMAVLAFSARFVIGGLPVVGGILSLLLLFAAIFGVVGGVYLVAVNRRQAA